jgi:hypothetical protein
MLGLGKEEPARGHDAQQMADHRHPAQAMRRAGDQDQAKRQGKAQDQRDDPKPPGMFAAHHMDHFAQQVVGAGMGRLECADAAGAAQTRGAGDGLAHFGEAGITQPPMRDLDQTCRHPHLPKPMMGPYVGLFSFGFKGV